MLAKVRSDLDHLLRRRPKSAPTSRPPSPQARPLPGRTQPGETIVLRDPTRQEVGRPLVPPSGRCFLGTRPSRRQSPRDLRRIGRPQGPTWREIRRRDLLDVTLFVAAMDAHPSNASAARVDHGARGRGLHRDRSRRHADRQRHRSQKTIGAASGRRSMLRTPLRRWQEPPRWQAGRRPTPTAW